MSYFYPWKVEHPHQSMLVLRIPCLAIMVYVYYCLFSSYWVPTSIREVLGSLGRGMECYLDIAQ